MREGVVFLRERNRPALGPGAVHLLRVHPAYAVALAGTLLMAGVGAFDSGEAAPWTLYSYWGILMAAGACASTRILGALDSRNAFAGSLPKRWAAASLLVVLPLTPLTWFIAAAAMGGSFHPLRLLELAPQVLLVASAFVALQLLMERSREPSPFAVSPAPPDRPAVLRRLPTALAGAELHAVEAEDHYLRFHTDRGSALLLMRLGDAMAELGGLDGAQTHRSWWVARDAVVGASRGGGRATLQLKGGISVPVSRTYSSSLRKAGWF